MTRRARILATAACLAIAAWILVAGLPVAADAHALPIDSRAAQGWHDAAGLLLFGFYPAALAACAFGTWIAWPEGLWPAGRPSRGRSRA